MSERCDSKSKSNGRYDVAVIGAGSAPQHVSNMHYLILSDAQD